MYISLNTDQIETALTMDWPRVYFPDHWPNMKRPNHWPLFNGQCHFNLVSVQGNYTLAFDSILLFVLPAPVYYIPYDSILQFGLRLVVSWLYNMCHCLLGLGKNKVWEALIKKLKVKTKPIEIQQHSIESIFSYHFRIQPKSFYTLRLGMVLIPRFIHRFCRKIYPSIL